MAGLSLAAELLRTAGDMFHYPDHDNLASLQAGLNRLRDWTTTMDENHRGDNGRSDSAQYLDLTPLQIDYTALFINAFPASRAHPFAGWYYGDALIMGSSDRKMRHFYSRYGMECDDMQIPADHIMVELEFLALMAERYHETGDVIFQQALQEMMHQHMEPWVFRFLEKVQENAQTDFYHRVAAVMLVLFRELTVQVKEVA